MTSDPAEYHALLHVCRLCRSALSTGQSTISTRQPSSRSTTSFMIPGSMTCTTTYPSGEPPPLVAMPRLASPRKDACDVVRLLAERRMLSVKWVLRRSAQGWVHGQLREARLNVRPVGAH